MLHLTGDIWGLLELVEGTKATPMREKVQPSLPLTGLLTSPHTAAPVKDSSYILKSVHQFHYFKCKYFFLHAMEIQGEIQDYV